MCPGRLASPDSTEAGEDCDRPAAAPKPHRSEPALTAQVDSAIKLIREKIRRRFVVFIFEHPCCAYVRQNGRQSNSGVASVTGGDLRSEENVYVADGRRQQLFRRTSLADSAAFPCLDVKSKQVRAVRHAVRQPAQFAERSPRCRTNGSKSRSLYNNESSFSMQLVAISVSIVFRILIPRVLSLRKFLAA